jgi:hypothetical protein
VTIDAGHLRLGQVSMDHLPKLTRGFDTRWRVAILASRVALGAHGVVHSLRKGDTPRFPRLLVVEIGGHFRENVANSGFHMHVRFDEPISFWDMAVAATRTHACRIADMRRLLVVWVSRQTSHAMA